MHHKHELAIGHQLACSHQEFECRTVRELRQLCAREWLRRDRFMRELTVNFESAVEDRRDADLAGQLVVVRDLEATRVHVCTALHRREPGSTSLSRASCTDPRRKASPRRSSCRPRLRNRITKAKQKRARTVAVDDLQLEVDFVAVALQREFEALLPGRFLATVIMD